MKRFLLLSLFLTSATLHQLQAQCTPIDCSSSLPPFGGLCDTSIADGVVNKAYSEQLSLVLGGVCFNVQLLDPSLPALNARITAVRNITFSNVPPGMSAATDRVSYNPPNGGRVLGCVSISGTPQQAGVFAIRIGLVADAVLCGIFPIPQNGNAVDFNFNFTIRPDATFSIPVQKFCIDDAAVDLSVQGTVGGIFSGPGVIGSSFSPALAGAGIHEITYTVAAQEGNAIAPAFNSFTITVEVSDEKTKFYADEDGDGYGDPDNFIESCDDTPPAGFVSNNNDCDDTDAEINPEKIWYQDADGDGYTTGSTLVQCEQPTGYVSLSQLINSTQLDCNDNEAAINPGAAEVCDGIDNNCNGLVDVQDSSVDPSELSTFYRDADGDGFGDPGNSVEACELPDGYVLNNNDCDDSNVSINPETVWYEDKDDDGFSSGDTLTQCEQPAGFKLQAELAGAEVDCDDEDASIYPGAEEIPNDGIDQDCDGEDLISTAILLSQSLNASVYPNPNQGAFLLRVVAEKAGVYEVRFMDSKGSLIDSKMYQLQEGAHQLDISTPHRGMLIITVTHEQGIFVGKVVIH